LAETDELSFKWRLNYIQTFLEQDISNLGITIPPMGLRRFWAMLAHYHGGGFAIEEILRIRLPIEAFFWSSTTAEVDLLIRHGQIFEAFECKYTKAPKLTPSMLEVVETFDLDMLTIVVPLSANFRIHEKVRVRGLKEGMF
jgi:predicted AAA+ superfamily ATPase